MSRPINSTDIVFAGGALEVALAAESSSRSAADLVLAADVLTLANSVNSLDSALTDEIDTRAAQVLSLESAKQNVSQRGQVNGYPSLDASGDVPIAQLPLGDTAQTVCVGNDVRLVVPSGFRSGFLIANSVVDPVNDVSVGVGVAALSNGVSSRMFSLGAALVKRFDAAWSVGNNGGGLDTGVLAPSSWYYLFAIGRSDTGQCDVIGSLSLTAPVLPPAYDFFLRLRVGAFRTGAGVVGILPATWFIDAGYCFFVTSISELNTVSAPVASVVVTAPPGFVWLGDFSYSDVNAGVAFGCTSGATAARGVLVSRTQVANVANFAVPIAPLRVPTGSVVTLFPVTANSLTQSVTTRGFSE